MPLLPLSLRLTPLRAWLVLPLLLALAVPGQARPIDQPMDASVLAQPGQGYSFSEVQLDSVDGARHYQVWIARPAAPAPAAGYPVLYLLDGNAALGGLNAELLDELARRPQPPVLVAVGYAGGKRIYGPGRVLDYTASQPTSERFREMPTGGADVFLAWLLDRLEPAVAQQVPLDRDRRALWGHSLGGLFVLHALLTRPDAFARGYAVSPSLWWSPDALPQDDQALAQRLQGHPAELILLQGGAEHDLPAQFQSAVPADATPRLAERLARIPGLTVHFTTLPDLGHGPMLPASLRWVVQHGPL
ncbi:esterase [Pseudomonas oryzihabitans]|uniref:alpha/beta hydrolase n=1 Tax=Pseudomonas rhizoryzae TaxID=2571129 RepID=UPI0007943371|nr:alpha/beta hydrolase-fold protein [Pseudomonas rhizoryzae]KTS77640.1 esterase [Pseudomonas psychrotolerans]KTT31490.1 esterase [Pseudomonas psychrotolerans]KTT32010.1 esterase [Pseudomonas psychrotolerans]KTT64654.1 esterase [Pseudomonas psychrotolerans]KTT75797.1 esterase [Pseudomonas psychrotolerans]